MRCGEVALRAGLGSSAVARTCAARKSRNGFARFISVAFISATVLASGHIIVVRSLIDVIFTSVIEVKR
jgi:hypothetical protein